MTHEELITRALELFACVGGEQVLKKLGQYGPEVVPLRNLTEKGEPVSSWVCALGLDRDYQGQGETVLEALDDLVKALEKAVDNQAVYHAGAEKRCKKVRGKE